MKELVENIILIAKWIFTDIFVTLYNASLGAIGELLDTLGYAKAIILAAVALITAAIKWMWSQRNR